MSRNNANRGRNPCDIDGNISFMINCCTVLQHIHINHFFNWFRSCELWTMVVNATIWLERGKFGAYLGNIDLQVISEGVFPSWVWSEAPGIWCDDVTPGVKANLDSSRVPMNGHRVDVDSITQIAEHWDAAKWSQTLVWMYLSWTAVQFPARSWLCWLPNQNMVFHGILWCNKCVIFWLGRQLPS